MTDHLERSDSLPQGERKQDGLENRLFESESRSPVLAYKWATGVLEDDMLSECLLALRSLCDLARQQ